MCSCGKKGVIRIFHVWYCEECRLKHFEEGK